MIFVFKQKTAYEMRISDWSSDVCSSDLLWRRHRGLGKPSAPARSLGVSRSRTRRGTLGDRNPQTRFVERACELDALAALGRAGEPRPPRKPRDDASRSEEHTSELQSLMRISYAVFCLKKQTQTQKTT